MEEDQGSTFAPNGVDPKIWDKLISSVGEEVLAEMRQMDSVALNALIAQAELNIREQEMAMKADVELAQAQVCVKGLAAPYKDAVKAQRAKQRVASYLLDQ